MPKLEDQALDQLFRTARTHASFSPEPVPDALLREAWDLAKMGPTGGNSNPMRVVFVRSPEAKARLKPLLYPGNVDKTMGAPVTAIFAYDVAFYEHLPRLFPHMPQARAMFADNPDAALDAARLSGSLQAAYFMLAARAVGLDCGPMAGFDRAKVDEEFLKGTTFRSNFLCNLGVGDGAKMFPRLPRLEFDEACTIL